MFRPRDPLRHWEGLFVVVTHAGTTYHGRLVSATAESLVLDSARTIGTPDGVALDGQVVIGRAAAVIQAAPTGSVRSGGLKAVEDTA